MENETSRFLDAVSKRVASECSLVNMLKNEADAAYYVMIDRVFCVITGVLFSIGCVANAWVIQRTVRSLMGAHTRACPRHVFIYIGALATTDFSLLLNCPFLIHDIANMQWNFGGLLCKWMYGNECLNKLLSGFLLAVLSFDQLITVRKILPPIWRSVSAASKITGSLIFMAVILLIPLFLYTRVITLVDDHRDNVTVLAIQKCVFAPPPDMIYLTNGFMLSVFVFGFCLPTVCISVSYGTILYRFAATGYPKKAVISRGNEDGGRPTRSRRVVTRYILLLIVIYLCCWTPYWIAAVQVSFAPQYYHDSQHYDLAITYALLYIHLLPYLNAVLNPFAYGCMVNFVSNHRRTRRSGETRLAAFNHRSDSDSRLSIRETWTIESTHYVDNRRKASFNKIDPSDIELGPILVNKTS